MIIYLPQIVMVVGLIIWLATDKPKISEISRLCFFAGLLTTCLNGIK